MVKLKNINNINTFFILVSIGVAFIVPFELLLFSYAVLGPLHYLTEIAWLHDRKYFTGTKLPSYFLYIIVTILALSSGFFISIEYLSQKYLLFLSLSFVVVYFLYQDKISYFETIFLFIFISIVFTQSIWVLLISLYLFTLIHVYIFTGQFMLLGTIKSGQGWLNVFLFILAPFIFILNYYYPIIELNYATSDIVQSIYNQTFGTLNSVTLKEVMGLNDSVVNNLFTSKQSVALTQFVSFAYTYHYLNWFSKTSVIGWHKNKYLWLTIVLWLGAVAIYFYNYLIGYQVLFLLSMAHVVLEFPLNQKTMRQLSQSIVLNKKKIN